MPRERVVIAFFQGHQRRESTRTPRRKLFVSRQKSIEAPQGAKEGHGRRAFAFFFRPSGTLDAFPPQGHGRRAFAFFFRPLRALDAFPPQAHGLRRGLRCFRAGALQLWPSRGRVVRDRGAVDMVAVGRAWASAASKRATRGSRNPDAPTAERSHWVRSSNRTNLDLRSRERCHFAGTQRRLRHHRRALGRTMRPLRGRFDTAGGSAGRALARCARRARPTAILSTAPRSRTRLPLGGPNSKHFQLDRKHRRFRMARGP